MELAFNLLLTILLELPVVSFFFRKRKRKSALLVCLLVNAITWPMANIIRLNTNWNLNMVEILVVILEGLGYWLIMNVGPKKSFLISILANLLSFVVTKHVYLKPEMFQKNMDIIR